MFKKIKTFLATMLTMAMVCVAPLTAYAENMTVDDIFKPDTGNVYEWESESEGWHMFTYHETSTGLNVIEFWSNAYYRNYRMVVSDDNIVYTEKGGLECYGDVYYTADNSYCGYYKVVWPSMEASDYPSVYVLFGDTYITCDETIAKNDYAYTGTSCIIN